MQTLVYLYSDDIATIQPYENVEDQEEEPITVEEYDESIDLGHGNDDKDYDGSCDSELITSCNDGDDLDNSTHSLSEIEDDSSSSSEDDDNDKNEIHQSAGTRSSLFSIQKMDMELSIRGFIILCLYSVAHGALYECFSTVLESVNAHLIWDLNDVLFLIAILISSITGTFHWYLDYMDDENECIYGKITELQRQKKKLYRFLIKKKKKKSTSSSSSTLLSLRLHIFQIKFNIRRKLRRIPFIKICLDLAAFYCVYTSCTNILCTKVIHPMIGTQKMDIINQLPSSRFNVTEGYHPSLLRRFLIEATKLEDDQKKNIRVNYEFGVDDELIRLLQNTINDDELKQDLNACIIDSIDGTIDDNIDGTTNNMGETQCESSNNIMHYDWDRDDHSTSTRANLDRVQLSNHFIAFQKLEAEWTEEDYLFFKTISSPESVLEFIGNYEATLMTCSDKLLVYAGILGVTFLVLLPLFGVSAGNIFE